MPLLFDTGRVLYHAAVSVAAPWSAKARAWKQGRQGQWQRLEARAADLQGCLWMHCASVGEFEQGRPVLEAIKRARPDLPVLLTFFSPSGYEARRNEPLATHVDHLPPDSAANAERLLRSIRPAQAIFVKYEFWYHHLAALHRHGVPTFLIAALFRKDQPFFRWYGADWRRMLTFFTAIGTQDEASAALLRGIGTTAVSVTGDTRFDRVMAIRDASPDLPLVQAFRGEGPALVLGSSWPPDEDLVLNAARDRYPKLIVVPHELDPARLDALEARLPKPLVRWSELECMDILNVAATLGREPAATLLVDRMGLLARLYHYGDVAHVGGGFTDGIHNLLEAAVWGRPVTFGPMHRKFPEAAGLIASGAGAEVRTVEDLVATLERWSGPALAVASSRAERYVTERIGATSRVLAMMDAAIGR